MSELPIKLFGYSRSEVDQLIENQQEEIKLLQDQIATLQAEIQKYHDLENVLKDSIVDARIKGNEIIEESTNAASNILDEANDQVALYKEEISQRGIQLVDSGLNLKTEMQTMKEKMVGMIQRFNDVLEATNLDEIYPDHQSEAFLEQIESVIDTQASVMPNEDDQRRAPENTLTEEEKENLHQLIQEVIANENKKDGSTVERKLFDLKVIKSN